MSSALDWILQSIHLTTSFTLCVEPNPRVIERQTIHANDDAIVISQHRFKENRPETPRKLLEEAGNGPTPVVHNKPPPPIQVIYSSSDESSLKLHTPTHSSTQQSLPGGKFYKPHDNLDRASIMTLGYIALWAEDVSLSMNAGFVDVYEAWPGL